MRLIATFTVLLLLAAVSGWPATRTSSKSASQKSQSSRRKSAPPAAKSASAKSSSSRRAAGRKGAKSAKGAKTVRQSWRSGQALPSSARYREIQQALIAKGYSNEPVTGTWGPEWANALKSFQNSQNLEPTGKLDSLSLIALGLGPKREATAAPGSSNSRPPGDHP